MQTKNVHYNEQPDRIIIYSNGKEALIELPVNVTEITISQDEEEHTEWVAETVYSIKSRYSNNLKDRIEANYDAWLEMAKKPEPQEVTTKDLIEAIDALQELIIGGEF